MMRLHHSDAIWGDFPELAAGALRADGIGTAADPSPQIVEMERSARARLGSGTESELAEIQAWRRAFSRMGLKPTQYRCASEALLRRFRKEGALPRIHPLIDLCNAVSIAFAIPIAVLDAARISGSLEVRRATGGEDAMGFSGEPETPERGEVIFADDDGRAHARRWCNRQTGHSIVRADTASVLIVAEAMHGSAAKDVERLVATLADALRTFWSVEPRSGILTRSAPGFEL